MDKRRAAVKATGIYLGTALASVAILIWVMKLWSADFSVPFHWKLGADVTFQAMLSKNLVEKGSLYTNSFLGAPGQLDLHDFPQPYFIHFFFMKLLSLVSHDFVVVFNLYFLLAFPLTAVVSLFVFRSFNFSWPSGVLGSLLFTFLPYHFMRGEAHFFLSTYYLVPLMVLAALWVSTGEPLFAFDRGAGKGGLVTHKGLISLGSCVLIALDNPYYAFFGAFFLVVAAARAYLRHGHTGSVLSTAILLTALVVTFSTSLTPNLIYFHRHGKNDKVAHRQMGESEYFGLKISQLVLPVTGHRVGRVADRKGDYNRETSFLLNEDDSASLGLIGSCGFLVLLGWLLFGRPGESTVPLLDAASVLNVSAVLLGTIGGFSSLFALEISTVIRAYNRISIYIGFLALFAVVLLLDKLRQGWVRQSWARPVRDRVLFRSLVLTLLVFGIFDQTTADFVPPYQEIKTEYQGDADFVRRIEASLPQGAMIFQLPYVAFPESRSLNRMRDYDHLRGYLHSRNLRWSYGAIKGRVGDSWEKETAALPTVKLVETLERAGFSGIYVDRFGYADQGVKLENELADSLHGVPVVSTDQRLTFFDFARVRAELP